MYFQLRVMLSVFAVVIGLSACQFDSKINQSNIHVSVTNPHPFLIDHMRMLEILDADGNTIDSEELYMDTGSGANSFLYKELEEWIVIDCNGMWYQITASGKISSVEWNWEQDLPNGYIGTFLYRNGEYKLEETELPSKDEVYRFKDPT